MSGIGADCHIRNLTLDASFDLILVYSVRPRNTKHVEILCCRTIMKPVPARGEIFNPQRSNTHVQSQFVS
jgi:hypothetical protein